MSTPTGASGLVPGDCLAILTQLRTHAKHRRRLAELPRRSRADLEDMLDAVRDYMSRDPHVGPMLEGAVGRLATEIAAGTLGNVQELDLRTVANFLLVVPPTPPRAR
jgi:hypothetical protein